MTGTIAVNESKEKRQCEVDMIHKQRNLNVAGAAFVNEWNIGVGIVTDYQWDFRMGIHPYNIMMYKIRI